MKAEIKEGILVVRAESIEENQSLRRWRKKYIETPKEQAGKKWFECYYCNPVQTVVL
jgi:hypothetical protein